MKTFMSLIKKLPLWAKFVIFFIYPIGTVAMIIYLIGSNINIKAKPFNLPETPPLSDDNVTDETIRQFNDFAMEEARKSVTPFDHGGYVQGDGFNPSDTMAADAQRQMDNLNQMNNMNM